MAAPSPQHGAGPSPTAPIMGRSPNPPHQSPTPTPATMTGTPSNNFKVLVESLPRLLEMKRAGSSVPEQEKLVRSKGQNSVLQAEMRQYDSRMASQEGRQQLDRLQTNHPSTFAQNQLTNPMGQPQTTSQLSHQQSTAAAQQQLTALQQQQELYVQAQAQAQAQAMQQSIQGFQQGMVPNSHLGNQQAQNSQLNVHHQAQLRLQQLAQANLVRQSAQNLNGSQAQIQGLSRGTPAQNLLFPAQNAIGVPQQRHLNEQSPSNFGSPRPLQSTQMQTNGVQRIPADKVAQIKAELQRVAKMTEQERDTYFQQVSSRVLQN